MQTNDYYRILQVHNLAEPEIIESAYKRLVRKYHPDVNLNGDTLEMMQMINEAYTTLSNPEKRKEYNQIWEEKNKKPAQNNRDTSNNQRKNEMLFLSAKALLEEYFRNIMKNNYGDCYELISSTDKNNMTREEFIHWQEAVSKVYNMKDFKCDLCGVYRDKLIQGQMFHDVLEFSVNTVEYNIVMDMMQKDNLKKVILLEDGHWRVYIGYEKLQPIISKFNDLRSLLNAKTVLNELVESHSKVDLETGLMNQRGIIENIEREIHRFNRYGNVFSMILCDIDIVKLINRSEEQEVINHVVKMIGELLTDQLRKLDMVGRWGNQSILLVLPETGLLPAIKVAHKMQKMLKEKNLILNDKIYKIVINYGISEYYSSFEETLDRIYNQLS